MTAIAPVFRSPRNPARIVSPSVLAPVIDWIDRELGETFAARGGRGGDCLLALRQVFMEESLNKVLKKFYQLLPRLEASHFLLGYRIRQWLSLNFRVRLSDPLERSPEVFIPIRFDQRSFKFLKHQFFKQAEALVPMNDIRMEIIPADQSKCERA